MAKRKDDNGVMEYTLMDINIPIPYPHNSKIHDKKNIQELQSSISRHGMTYPITVDKNMVIIGGHGRLEACKALGMRFVKVQVLDHLDEQGVKEARIAENRTASTQYDSLLMKAEFADMNLDNLDLSSIGFTEEEFQKLNMTLDEVDMSAFTENLDKDVDHQAKESVNDVKKADLKLAAVTNGLGFKMVSVGDNRKIARFVAGLQEQYSLEDPAAAFVRFVEEMEAA